MKKIVSNIWTYVALIFLVAFVIWWKSCRQKEELKQIPNTEYKAPDKVFVDEKGNQHSQQTAIETTSKILDKMVDSLLSENKNLNKALLLAQSITRVDTVFQQHIIYKDSLKEEFQISKNDKDIDLTVTGNLRTGASSISLRMRDTLSVVMSEKKHWFKPNETLVDISHSNNYLKDEQMRSFTVPQKRVVVAIGPAAGVGWTGTKIVPFVGVGAVINLIGIKTKR